MRRLTIPRPRIGSRRWWLVPAALAVSLIAYVFVAEVLLTPGYPARTVAEATTPYARQEGVRKVPLKPGQSLAFDFGHDTVARWNMAGVEYPLILTALDRRGKTMETLLMRPCATFDVKVCPIYRMSVSARYYVETRPADNFSPSKD